MPKVFLYKAKNCDITNFHNKTFGHWFYQSTYATVMTVVTFVGVLTKVTKVTPQKKFHQNKIIKNFFFSKKVKMWQKPKTQNVTKLKIRHKSSTQNVKNTKKNSKFDQTQNVSSKLLFLILFQPLLYPY